MNLISVISAAAADAGTHRIIVMFDRLRLLLFGVIAGLAALMLTIAALRYMTANGDPGKIERAKSAIAATFVGIAIAVLATVLVGIAKRVFQA